MWLCIDFVFCPEQATIKRNERFVFQLSYQPTSDAPLPQVPNQAVLQLYILINDA